MNAQHRRIDIAASVGSEWERGSMGLRGTAGDDIRNVIPEPKALHARLRRRVPLRTALRVFNVRVGGKKTKFCRRLYNQSRNQKCVSCARSARLVRLNIGSEDQDALNRQCCGCATSTKFPQKIGAGPEIFSCQPRSVLPSMSLPAADGALSSPLLGENL
jgi:hypothetical protein